MQGMLVKGSKASKASRSSCCLLVQNLHSQATGLLMTRGQGCTQHHGFLLTEVGAGVLSQRAGGRWSKGQCEPRGRNDPGREQECSPLSLGQTPTGPAGNALALLATWVSLRSLSFV